MLRGSGNVLWPEGEQGARREWMWRTCPPKGAEGKRKPLQEDEHSAGQAREEVGEVGRGQRRMGCYRKWCSGEGLADETVDLREHQRPDCQTWRKRTQDHADSEQMDVGIKAPE